MTTGVLDYVQARWAPSFLAFAFFFFSLFLRTGPCVHLVTADYSPCLCLSPFLGQAPLLARRRHSPSEGSSLNGPNEPLLEGAALAPRGAPPTTGVSM